MTLEPKMVLRLQFLARVVRKECRHLATTDSRLFKGLFTCEQVLQFEADPDLSERVSTTHHCFSVETLRFFHPTNNT
jgi:hypothetical protein